MVTTRSGKKTTESRNTNNVTTRNTRNTRTTRNTRNTKTTQQVILNKINSIPNIVENIDYNIVKRRCDYIFRTVNINDMSDFDKITKYSNKYPEVLYIVKSNDITKSFVAYNICTTEQLKETIVNYLVNNNNVISKTSFKLYLVLSNYKNTFYKIRDVLDYKLKNKNSFTITPYSNFEKLIEYRDYAIKKLL